jgi:hypothetical protein
MDLIAERWLRAFENGVRERRNDLLPAVVARVAPEYLVVSCALHGLLSLHDASWSAHLEHRIERKPGRKCDLVMVEDGGSARQYYFEFKALWPGGVPECVGYLLNDRAKLKGVPNSYLVAFTYAMSNSQRFKTDRQIEYAIDGAIEKLGPPCFGLDSEPIAMDGFDARGVAKLIAWQVGE